MASQIPFAPSLAITRKLLSDTNPDQREFAEIHVARTVIAGDRILSVPVAGGAGRLKHHGVNLSDIIISNHGRWRQEHLGAINAAYGRTPFFTCLYPRIEKIYASDSHDSLGDFNASLFNMVKDFLETETIMPAIMDMRLSHPERMAQLRRENESKVNVSYSIFDSLFRLGKDTVFIL